MKCLIKYTINLRCEASSKKDAERYLKPDINRLKAFCSAFDVKMRTIVESYVPGSGNGRAFGIEYLFSYEISWEGEFRYVLKVTTAIQSFADVNAIEVADEKVIPFDDED